jgi:hypothetical protein
LYYYGFRFYDPNLQRWLNRDPLGEFGSLNLFGFVGNNPKSKVDPEGDSANNVVSTVTAPPSANFNPYGPLTPALPVDFNDMPANFPTAPEKEPDTVRSNPGEFKDNNSGPASCEAFMLEDSGPGAEKLANNYAVAVSMFLPMKIPGGPRCPLVWPKTAQEMNNFLKVEGQVIPDLLKTPGRNKTVWELGPSKITHEAHPYDIGAPADHTDPHWHLDTPGKDHVRYLPGDPIPGH